MQTEAYLSVKSQASLVVLEEGQIKTYYLGNKIRWKFGRECPGNVPDIPVNSTIVGRKHGEFACIEGEWYFIDGGSLNGTYCNGEKIEKNEATQFKLCNGDILRVDSKNLNTPDDRGLWMMFVTEELGNNWLSYKLNPEKTVTIGRSEEESDIVLLFPYISRKHAVIKYSDGRYYVSDCDSTAGTWLNGERIGANVLLREKDKISICNFHFIFTGNVLIYNVKRNKGEKVEKIEIVDKDVIIPTILEAHIDTKKVPNNSGSGEKELIRDVHLQVKEGSLVALLGSSGAGKTTVMNCLNGMDLKGVKGTVKFRGEDLFQNFQRLKYLIGSVPQEEVFHPMLSVEEELKEAAIIRLPSDTKKKEIKEQVDKTIKQLGLEGVRKSKILKCSGGEKKRVNIAIELVAERELLCLDEPDAGLDPGMKKELFTILQNLAHEGGKSILVIIHDVSDIDMFDQIIMMAKVDNVGRLAFSGTPKEAKEFFGTSIKEAYSLLSNNPEKYIK